MLKLIQPDPDELVEEVNAPLIPDLRASNERGFRPLTDEEKKDFVGSLDANGRQILANLESLPKPFWLRATEDHRGGNQLLKERPCSPVQLSRLRRPCRPIPPPSETVAKSGQLR